MRFLDKLINFIFSLFMIVLSVVVLLTIFNYTSTVFVDDLLYDFVWNVNYKNIVAIIAVLVFLAGLKTTIFLSDFKTKKKVPIIVNNDNGNVQISAETVETTAKAAAMMHGEIKDVNAKMVNRKKGIDIYMTLLVIQDTNIRELTSNIQEEVKNSVHNTTGVEVFNVDIKVKNVIEKNNKGCAEKNNKVTENKVVENKVKTEAVEEQTENDVSDENTTDEETTNM